MSIHGPVWASFTKDGKRQRMVIPSHPAPSTTAGLRGAALFHLLSNDPDVFGSTPLEELERIADRLGYHDIKVGFGNEPGSPY